LAWQAFEKLSAIMGRRDFLKDIKRKNKSRAGALILLKLKHRQQYW
jgi:hypothetical protein